MMVSQIVEERNALPGARTQEKGKKYGAYESQHSPHTYLRDALYFILIQDVLMLADTPQFLDDFIIGNFLFQAGVRTGEVNEGEIRAGIVQLIDDNGSTLVIRES